MVRICVIAASIYHLGYQQGIAYFARNPQTVEDELIRLVLGMSPKQKLEDALHGRYDAKQKAAEAVTNKLLECAHVYCKHQLQLAEAELALMQYPDRPALRQEVQRLRDEQPVLSLAAGGDKGQLQSMEGRSPRERVVIWTAAMDRISGKWRVLVVKSRQINAFVTGMCPRKVFIFDGLLDRLSLSVDELAMVIGHELSHVVLGHTEEQIPWRVITLSTQLLLMGLMDPTGAASFFFDMAASYARQAVETAYSRRDERDADELGVLLVSLSCYDVNAAVNLHQKMAKLQGEAKTTGLLDSHPASAERHEQVEALAKQHSADRVDAPLFEKYRKDCVRYRTALSAIGIRL